MDWYLGKWYPQKGVFKIVSREYSTWAEVAEVAKKKNLFFAQVLNSFEIAD